MWKIFKPREQADKEHADESQEFCLKQMKAQLEAKLKRLTQMFTQAEPFFSQYANPKAAEESLGTTFEELIATLEGLITIVQQLRVDQQGMQQRLKDYQQMKSMLANHQRIIQSIEESNSAQMSKIYQDKTATEKELQSTIESLSIKYQTLQKDMVHVRQRLQDKQKENQTLNERLLCIQAANKSLQNQLNSIQSKYRAVTNSAEPKHKKVVDIQHLKLEYLFYYTKTRQLIVSFLSIPDFTRLQQSSKFYKHTLNKMQGKHFYNCFKKSFSNKQTNQMQAVKAYEKVYELFSSQNIKNSAFKYLYFKIKPATYMLPYLQDEPTELPKPQLQTQSVAKEKYLQKFSWRGIFSAEKQAIKGQKKEQAKFSLSSLKNEQQFKKVETKMESLFRNILPLKMPEDLVYFSETTERQLKQLKAEISQIKGRNNQVEWTAQIFTLARFMYYEINELYNLLLVIFGDLISKNKQIATLREDCEYLKDTELVLRNLIENISQDKSLAEKKVLSLDNDMLKLKLSQESLANNNQGLKQDLLCLAKELNFLKTEHQACKDTIKNYKEQNNKLDNRLQSIREQLELMDKVPLRSRNNSFVSASSEDKAEPCSQDYIG